MIFANLFKPKDLFSAAKSGSAEAMEDLVVAGHDVNAKKAGFVREGFRPLHIAVLHQQEDAIKALVRLGALLDAKNDDGETPLWIAVSEVKQGRIVELLIDLGAKLNLQRDGMTALDLAAFNGNRDLVELLLRRGAKPNPGRGWTQSSPAAHCAHNGNIEILKCLIKGGADVNVQHCGSDALGTAAVFGHAEFVRILLEAKADPNQAESGGTTPLMSAVAGGKIGIVQMLTEAGANLNAVRFRAEPETALDFAEDCKKTSIAEYLRSVGAKRATELPASETTPPPEEPSGQSWQLRDDSLLDATLEPWPPRSGLAKLKVEISPNGHDPRISFTGTLEYRLAASEDTSGAWKPLKRGRKDEENNVRYSESVTLTRGSLYVQFRVHPEWEKDSTVLKDWKIEVA